uniref:THAP-type domain-containing protein n=1 Tax=Strigamia maritima TaxID=126957 RepID=T1IRV2_STRMM
METESDVPTSPTSASSSFELEPEPEPKTKDKIIQASPPVRVTLLFTSSWFFPREFLEMVFYCAVYICRKNAAIKREKLTFFRFPTEQTLRDEWMEVLQLKTIHPSYRICSKHFSSDSFEVSPEIFKSIGWKDRVKLKLKAGAIPTKYLTSNVESDEKPIINIASTVYQPYIFLNHTTVLERTETEQIFTSTNFEEEDAPCLERELTLEMVGTINSQHPIVRVAVDEDTSWLENYNYMQPVVKTDENERSFVSETVLNETLDPGNVVNETLDPGNIVNETLDPGNVVNETYFDSGNAVNENFEPANVKIEADDRSITCFQSDLVEEPCVKIEVMEDSDIYADERIESCMDELVNDEKHRQMLQRKQVVKLKYNWINQVNIMNKRIYCMTLILK